MLSSQQYENRKKHAHDKCDPEKKKLLAHVALLDEEFAYIKANAEALVTQLDEMIESDSYDYYTMQKFSTYLAAVNADFESPSEQNHEKLCEAANALYKIEHDSSTLASWISLASGLLILLAGIILLGLFAGLGALTFGVSAIVICSVFFGISAVAFSTSAGTYLHRTYSDGASNTLLKLADAKTFNDIHENFTRKNDGQKKAYSNRYGFMILDNSKTIVAKPSKLTRHQVLTGYIHCKNNSYKKFSDENNALAANSSDLLSGKWVLKFPAKSPAIDDAWRKIENAVAKGNLHYAKASPVSEEHNDQIICVYTDNHLNKKEIWYTYEELIRLGISKEYIQGYKRDIDTASNNDAYIYVPDQYYKANPASFFYKHGSYETVANKTEPGCFSAKK